MDPESGSLSYGGSKNTVVDNVCTSSNTDIDFCFPPGAHLERSKCTTCILEQWSVESESDAAISKVFRPGGKKVRSRL